MMVFFESKITEDSLRFSRCNLHKSSVSFGLPCVDFAQRPGQLRSSNPISGMSMLPTAAAAAFEWQALLISLLRTVVECDTSDLSNAALLNFARD